MNTPIAVVHWLEVDGSERSAPFYSDSGLKAFVESLQKGGICYFTCLCGASIPLKASRRLAEIV